LNQRNKINQCPIHPSWLLTKLGNCSRAYRCNDIVNPKCPVNKSCEPEIIKTCGGGKKMDEKLRAELSKIKLDEAEVLKLLKSGMTVWEVTEKLYNTQFDHSDKKTWKFYSKVNSIRKRKGIPV